MLVHCVVEQVKLSKLLAEGISAYAACRRSVGEVLVREPLLAKTLGTNYSGLVTKKGNGGVGVMLAEKWIQKVIHVNRVNDRLMLLKVLVGKRVVTIISTCSTTRVKRRCQRKILCRSYTTYFKG